jgi:Bacterial DNA-binding protein
VVELLQALASLARAETLSNGAFVLPGIGLIERRESLERMARNPATGEPIDVNRIDGYRFEVFHADRFTSKSYDRIEIGFRVYGDGDEQSRAPFDHAFNGRMRVVDSAGHTFPVIVQPMNWTDAHYSPLRGYLGIVKLGGRNAATAATPLDDFRLVIESPDPSDSADTIEVRLRF